MSKQIIALFLIIPFLTLCSSSFAAPVINEFSSGDSNDWVEIYNPDESSIDLSVYRIRDLTSNNKLDLSGIINSKSFTVFDWSNKLNNGGDLIKLVLISDESVTDQVSYGDQGGGSAPGANQSSGRQTDGGSSWVLFTSSSKGASNNSSAVLLPPSATPTKTLTPTKSPTPSKTPTAAKSGSTAEKTPTKTPTAKSSQAQSSGGSGVKSTSPLTTKSNSDRIAENSKIASDFARVRNVSEPSKRPNTVAVLSARDNKLPFLVTIGGLLLLVAGALWIAIKYIDFRLIYEKFFNE